SVLHFILSFSGLLFRVLDSNSDGYIEKEKILSIVNFVDETTRSGWLKYDFKNVAGVYCREGIFKSFQLPQCLYLCNVYLDYMYYCVRAIYNTYIRQFLSCRGHQRRRSSDTPGSREFFGCTMAVSLLMVLPHLKKECERQYAKCLHPNMQWCLLQ